MFVVDCQKNQARVRQTEPITSGSQNVYVVQFNLSEEWDPLTATAVFMAGSRIINVLLDEDRECMVPWEVMQYPGEQVMVGVFGTMGGNVILPTIWASMGNLQQGVTTGIYGLDPTPSVYQQIVDELGRLKDQMQYGIPYAIDGLVDTTITSISQISNLNLPCNVILLNTSFSAGAQWLDYRNEIVYLELKEDPTGQALTLTDWDGNVYDLKIDDAGNFFEMVFVRDGTIKTPYQLAVDNGFEGTEVEWLNSLRAKTLYEIAVDNGFEGTETEFLESLKGADGKDGTNGEDGKDGTDGANGVDGSDGKSAYWVNVVTPTIPSAGDDITVPASEWNILPTEAGEFVSGTIQSPADAVTPFLYFIIGKAVDPINDEAASVHIDTMVSLIVDIGDIKPKLINSASTTTVLNGGAISEEAGNTAGVESIEAISAWVKGILATKQDILPAGETGTVLTATDDGYAPQAISNDILPIVDAAHGGTGQTTLGRSAKSLLGSLSSLSSPTTAIHLAAYQAMPAGEDSIAGYITPETLLTWATGRSLPVNTAGTDYTTLRVRSMALTATSPSGGYVNGCLYAVLSQ